MKAFFQGMNFPRFVILLSFVASLALGWFVYDRSARLDEIKLNLTKVGAEITKMQSLGIELERYQDQVATSGTISQADLQTYIRDTAALPKVGVGSLTVTPAKSKTFNKNTKDIIYKIVPRNKTQHYSRNSIANFFYKLELDNRRVKVTSYGLKPFSSGRNASNKPGEIFESDRWTFEAEITYRTKADAN